MVQSSTILGGTGFLDIVIHSTNNGFLVGLGRIVIFSYPSDNG